MSKRDVHTRYERCAVISFLAYFDLFKLEKAFSDIQSLETDLGTLFLASGKASQYVVVIFFLP